MGIRLQEQLPTTWHFCLPQTPSWGQNRPHGTQQSCSWEQHVPKMRAVPPAVYHSEGHSPSPKERLSAQQYASSGDFPLSQTSI